MEKLEWSVKRKLIYLSGLFLFLFVVIFSIYFIFSYQKPTCFDGRQNRGEIGIDCGGPCSRLCSFEVKNPIIHWSRSFEVSPGIYSSVAFIENPNINASAESASYVFKIRDGLGNVLAERSGVVLIPNTRTIVVFEPNFEISGEVSRTDFEFTSEIIWHKDETRPSEIFVSRNFLSREESTPRLEAQIENRSIFDIDRLEVVALIFDGNKNAIGASRTFLNDFKKDSQETLIFTWPKPFEVQEFVCENPVDMMLVFDRSGSMVFDNWDLENPEPLNSAKRAASGFLEKLFSNVRGGLVSFATEATLDIPLTGDIAKTMESVAKISVLAETPAEVWTQETNITHGLNLAFQEISSNSSASSEKVIILFTDGVPTHPKTVDRADFPMVSALELSKRIKSENITIFSIGLGEEQIDEEFLASLATSPSHYFGASKSADLFPIFSSLAETICREAPTAVEIITKEI